MAIIDNRNSYTIVSGTAYADTIHNDGGNDVSINAGKGNDSIQTDGHNVTVSGGKGNDYVKHDWGVGMAYVYTSGNDTLKCRESTALVIADGWTSQRSDDSTVIISVKGKGTITLVDYRSDVNIVSSLKDVKHYNLNWNATGNRTFTGTSGDDYMWNSGNKVLINPLAGNDFIDNIGENVTIDAGAGMDTVENNGAKASILGGAGNDSIVNWNNNVTISGGKSNDSILNRNGNYVSINGGKGNDYIYNGGAKVTLSGGDGNDSIGNQNSGDVLINGGDGNDYIYNGGAKVTLTGGKGNDSIQNVGNNIVISGGKGNDTIENGGFNTTIFGGAGNDTVYNREASMVYVYKSGDGNDFIGGFGILDTFVIDGANYTTVKSGSDVLVTVGKNKITLEGAASLAKVNIAKSTKGLKPVNVIRNETSNTVVSGKSTPNRIYNSGSNVTINGGKGTNDIYSSGGSNVVLKGGGGNNRIRGYGSNISILGGALADNITASGLNITVNAGKGNDSIYAYGFVNINYANGDGNDTVRLSDSPIPTDVTVNIKSGTVGNPVTNKNGDITLKVGKGSLTFQNVTGNTFRVKNSKGSVVALNRGRQIIENTANKKTIKKTSDSWYVNNSGSVVKISLSSGADAVDNYGSKVTISGGAGNDSIRNYDNTKVTIIGGTGNDSITNSGSKVLFKYSAGDGNDIISGFNATSTLQIAGSTYSTKKSGSNVVVTVGKGKITLDGAATLDTVNIVSDTMKITDSTKSPVTLNSSYKNADASTRTKAVKITGNSLANSIVGGSGNDTLTGGKGNDSLWGGGGSDTFIYSSGKDVISGFGSDDLLKITGTFSAPTYNKSDKSIAFKVGKTSDAITLRDFGTTTTFHVNSTTYQLSGGKLRAR